MNPTEPVAVPARHDPTSPTPQLTPTPPPREPRSAATLTASGVTYTRHPLSALFPHPDAASYALLKDSIRSVGLQRPIALLPDHVVLDGWTRLRACIELGLEPHFESVSEEADLADRVVALNLAQRILSASQRALIAAELATMRRGGDRPGAGRPARGGGETRIIDTAADARAGHLQPGDQINQTVKIQFESPPLRGAADATSIDDAARRLAVSPSYVTKAKKIANAADPALSEAVRAGTISLGEAYDVATKQPKQSHLAWLAERIKIGTAQAKKEARDAAAESKALAKQVRELRRIPPGRTKEDVAGVLIADALTATASINLLGEFIGRGDFPADDPNLGGLHDAVLFLNESIAKATPRRTPRAG